MDGVPSWSIFLLLQMVSHPGQSSYCCGWCPILVNLLIVVDGVPSWSIFLLLWMVSHPGHSTRNYERRCQSISCIIGESKLVPCNPGHGTKIMRGKDGFSTTVHSSIWCHNNPGHGTKIMRGKDGFSATLHSSIWHHDNPGHCTKIMRGMNLFSGDINYLAV